MIRPTGPFPSRCLALALLLVSVSVAEPTRADAIDDIPPGSWYEVPGSEMQAVIPMPPLPNQGGVGSIMSAWSGGAYDEAGERLLVWGGGHADYSGNEVYAFDLNTLSWSIIWGPTAESDIPSGMEFETYLDGNPSSRHTYSGLAHVPPPIDALYALGGSRWQNGYGTAAVWRLDLAAGTWSRMTDYPGGVNFGDATAYDPITGHLFHRGLTVFGEYDPTSDTWQNRYEDGAGWYQANITGALDPVRRLMVIAGNGDLSAFHLDDHTYQSPASTGGQAVIDSAAPGFAYDAKQGLFVAWAGGSDVYTLDPDTWEWLVHTGAGSPPGAAQPNGTFGRFRYAPSRNVFVLANAVDQNVFIYRLSEGGGVPPPEGTGGGGAGGDAGTGGASGVGGSATAAGGSGATPSADGSCGCRLTAPSDRHAPFALGLLLLGALWRRRRSSAST
ncbi:MAG: hypothetical protein KC731_24670 [Myxococcales bacterium]|nr:hypothetical protein [Myxococcales bacterium]